MDVKNGSSRRIPRLRRSGFAALLGLAALSPLGGWAGGADGVDEPRWRPEGRGGPALDVLDRERRVPEEGEAYVDIHGPALGWEREALERQGYVAPR